MSNALVPFSDLQQMGIALAKSGLFGVKSPEQAIALMLVAQAEGQHPATIAQDYDIIQGKATRKTHSVLARFQQSGGKVEWHALTSETADATFSHPQGGKIRMDWTLEQAKKAGLTGKDNWRNYPRAMLRARCIAEGVRAIYPAAIGGMLVAEEAQDMAPSVSTRGTPEPTAVADYDLLPRLLAEVEAAATEEAVATIWKAGVKEINATGDKSVYDQFKEGVTKRGKELKNAAVTDVEVKPEKTLLERIQSANQDELEALGPEIDGAPQAQQAELNDAFNARVTELDANEVTG